MGLVFEVLGGVECYGVFVFDEFWNRMILIWEGLVCFVELE